jgi:hypothetical protein
LRGIDRAAVAGHPGDGHAGRRRAESIVNDDDEGEFERLSWDTALRVTRSDRDASGPWRSDTLLTAGSRGRHGENETKAMARHARQRA